MNIKVPNAIKVKVMNIKCNEDGMRRTMLASWTSNSRGSNAGASQADTASSPSSTLAGEFGSDLVRLLGLNHPKKNNFFLDLSYFRLHKKR